MRQLRSVEVGAQEGFLRYAVEARMRATPNRRAGEALAARNQH